MDQAPVPPVPSSPLPTPLGAAQGCPKQDTKMLFLNKKKIPTQIWDALVLLPAACAGLEPHNSSSKCNKMGQGGEMQGHRAPLWSWQCQEWEFPQNFSSPGVSEPGCSSQLWHPSQGAPGNLFQARGAQGPARALCAPAAPPAAPGTEEGSRPDPRDATPWEKLNFLGHSSSIIPAKPGRCQQPEVNSNHISWGLLLPLHPQKLRAGTAATPGVQARAAAPFLHPSGSSDKLCVSLQREFWSWLVLKGQSSTKIPAPSAPGASSSSSGDRRAGI